MYGLFSELYHSYGVQLTMLLLNHDRFKANVRVFDANVPFLRSHCN